MTGALRPVVAAAAALASTIAWGDALPGPKSLDFDRTFDARGEPASVHYRARYTLAGQAHEVEVWRDGAERLKRRTDGRFETYVTRPKGEAEWQMVVLDLHRRLRTDVARTNLYRIGNFSDWFGLANSLSRPSGGYMLVAAAGAPSVNENPIAACKWYTLTRSGVASKVCWSRAERVPLMVADRDGHVQWRIVAIDRAAPAAATFAMHDDGFVRNDANRDIQAD